MGTVQARACCEQQSCDLLRYPHMCSGEQMVLEPSPCNGDSQMGARQQDAVALCGFCLLTRVEVLRVLAHAPSPFGE